MRSVIDRRALYIGGEWVSADSFEPVIDPATEEVLGEAPIASGDQIEAALAAARHAYDHGPWSRISQAERQAKLTIFLDVIERRRDEIVDLIVAEAGSPRALSQFLQYGIPLQHARHMVELSSRPTATPLAVETGPNARGTSTLSAGVLVRDAVGVVLAITPYNFPFFLNLGKVIPAMAVGCTTVLKPSPYTPFEAILLGEIAEESDLPAGVLNVVTGGNDVGTMLTTDRRVDLVSFTGSDIVGAKIQAQSAPSVKRLLLELGGKSALIVRPDADLDLAVGGGLSFTTHCGQGCALLTRLIVHNSVRKRYVELLRERLAGIRIGHPADPATMLGPMIRDIARRRTEEYVEIAKSEGARLVFGGRRPAGLDKGFYYEPTLFDDVDNRSRIAQEEVFGPIAVVIGYDDDDEAIALANDSDFGLSGAIYSGNPGLAYEMALKIRTGAVTINGGSGRMSSHFPFGGIKRSGYGREYGLEGLNEFTTLKTISFRAA